MRHLHYFVSFIILLGACAPFVNTRINNGHEPLSDPRAVVVYNPNDSLPEKCEVLGQVEVTSGAFVEDGKYDHILILAVEEARKNGGNALKIEKHEAPSLFGPSGHSIEANILRIPGINPDSLVNNNPEVDKLIEGMRYSPFRLVVNAGIGRRLGKESDIPADFKDYMDDLRNEWLLGVEATWFFTRMTGIGIEYSRIYAKNEIDIYRTSDNGKVEYGKLSDDIQNDFYAISWNGRFVSPSRTHSFQSSLSMGYVAYRNNFRVIEAYTLKGGAFGLRYSIGYDYHFSKNWALGLSGAIFLSTLRSFSITSDATQVEQPYVNAQISLSRLTIETGIRYNLPLQKCKFEK